MERKDTCPDDDIICIADTLAEISEAPREESPLESLLSDNRDCLPCLLADFDVEEQE